MESETSWGLQVSRKEGRFVGIKSYAPPLFVECVFGIEILKGGGVYSFLFLLLGGSVVCVLENVRGYIIGMFCILGYL